MHEPGGFAALAAGVKRRVGMPVIAVGRLAPEPPMRSSRDGDADFVAMGRKLLADPDLPRKLAAGADADVRPCIYSLPLRGQRVPDARRALRGEPEHGRRARGARWRRRARRDAERVLVVGGGPAGLEAARVRSGGAGTRSSSASATERLGGALRLAARTVRPPIADAPRWLERHVRRPASTCGSAPR